MGLFNSKKKNDQQNQQMYNQMGGNPMMPPQQGYGQPQQFAQPQYGQLNQAQGMGPMPSQQGSVNRIVKEKNGEH